MAININEYTKVTLPGDPSHEWLTIEESVNVVIAAAVTALSVSVSDGLAINEQIQAAEDALQINKTESVRIVDNSNIMLESFISKVESLGISESKIVGLSDLGISNQDNLRLSESAQAIISIPGISKSDNVRMSESVNVALSSPIISVFENVRLLESVNIALADFAIPVSDVIKLSENVSAEIPAAPPVEIDISDNIGLNDLAAAVLADLDISTANDLALNESVSTEIGAEPPLLIDLADGIGLDDLTQVYISDLSISTLDDISIGESTQTSLSDPEISKQDNFILSEFSGIQIQSPDFYSISVEDGISFDESVSEILTIPGISVSDNTALSDMATVELGAVVTGTVDLTLYDRSQNLTLDNRFIDIALYDRSQALTLDNRSLQDYGYSIQQDPDNMTGLYIDNLSMSEFEIEFEMYFEKLRDFQLTYLVQLYNATKTVKWELRFSGYSGTYLLFLENNIQLLSKIITSFDARWIRVSITYASGSITVVIKDLSGVLDDSTSTFSVSNAPSAFYNFMMFTNYEKPADTWLYVGAADNDWIIRDLKGTLHFGTAYSDVGATIAAAEGDNIRKITNSGDDNGYFTTVSGGSTYPVLHQFYKGVHLTVFDRSTSITLRTK